MCDGREETRRGLPLRGWYWTIQYMHALARLLDFGGELTREPGSGQQASGRQAPMAAWRIASPTVSGLSFPCRDCPSLCGRALLGSHASEDRRSETARPQKTATCPVILPNGAVTRHGAVALDWPDLARPTESCLSGGGGAKAGWPAMKEGRPSPGISHIECHTCHEDGVDRCLSASISDCTLVHSPGRDTVAYLIPRRGLRVLAISHKNTSHPLNNVSLVAPTSPISIPSPALKLAHLHYTYDTSLDAKMGSKTGRPPNYCKCPSFPFESTIADPQPPDAILEVSEKASTAQIREAYKR